MSAQEQQGVNFADCYVLTGKRTKEFILSFLDTFLPNRQEYGDRYEVPQFSDNPTVIFNSANQLIAYLEENKNEIHAIYWYNKEEAVLRGTMCLFTSDGQVILGIFCETLYPDTTIEDNYLKDLLNFCNSTQGLIEYEMPAAQDTTEFLKRVKAYSRKKPGY